jgi:hypothetical protein
MELQAPHISGPVPSDPSEYTVIELAVAAGVHPHTVGEHIRLKRLPAQLSGRRYVVAAADAQQFIRRVAEMRRLMAGGAVMA